MIGFACYILSFLFDKNPKAAENRSPNTSLKSILYYSGWTIALIGILCKIMHWPGFLYLVIGGTILAAISFFMPTKTDPEKDESLLDN